MATTPQSLTQGFLQSAGNLQSQAQNNVPVSANNGNPYTIYNQTPQQGGYLPPVSNAYDQWRINPSMNFGGGMVQPMMGNGGFGFPTFNFNPNNGGGTLPVLPPTTPTATPPPTVDPTTPPTDTSYVNGGFPTYGAGSGGWMAGAPARYGSGGGTLNTSYTAPYFGVGISGQGFSQFGNGGFNNSGSSGSFSGFNPNGMLGRIADWILPGDAIQTAGMNWGNLGLGIAGQQTGLPLTWLAERLADSNWAQTSNSRVAQWLRNWNESNDLEAMQQYYNDPANGTRGAMEGWLAGAYTPSDPNAPLTPEQQQAQYNRAMALFNARATGLTAEEIYRREGVQGLARRGYTPAQINRASGQGQGTTGGMGIGIHASGAFTPGMADVLQGDAARAAFAQMLLSQRISPQFQIHNQQD